MGCKMFAKCISLVDFGELYGKVANGWLDCQLHFLFFSEKPTHKLLSGDKRHLLMKMIFLDSFFNEMHLKLNQVFTERHSYQRPSKINIGTSGNDPITKTIIRSTVYEIGLR
jgi:hypothetical protein